MLPLRNDIWALEIVAQITYTAEIREAKMKFLLYFDSASNKRGGKKKDKRSGQEETEEKVKICELEKIQTLD
jgi:hypothetical protein